MRPRLESITGSGVALFFRIPVGTGGTRLYLISTSSGVNLSRRLSVTYTSSSRHSGFPRYNAIVEFLMFLPSSLKKNILGLFGFFESSTHETSRSADKCVFSKKFAI